MFILRSGLLVARGPPTYYMAIEAGGRVADLACGGMLIPQAKAATKVIDNVNPLSVPRAFAHWCTVLHCTSQSSQCPMSGMAQNTPHDACVYRWVICLSLEHKTAMSHSRWNELMESTREEYCSLPFPGIIVGDCWVPICRIAPVLHISA